jgi:hypothetical protein
MQEVTNKGLLYLPLYAKAAQIFFGYSPRGNFFLFRSQGVIT